MSNKERFSDRFIKLAKILLVFFVTREFFVVILNVHHLFEKYAILLKRVI